LLAFLHAVNAGVTHIETDVHGSADGVAMISHDPDLARVAGREVRVSQLTAAELRRVALGEGQSYCSLADALDAFPETRFNIDIKSADAVPGAIKAIRDLGATERVLIGSFSTKRRLAVVRELPGVATSISAGGAVPAAHAARAGAVRMLARLAGDLRLGGRVAAGGARGPGGRGSDAIPAARRRRRRATAHQGRGGADHDAARHPQLSRGGRRGAHLDDQRPCRDGATARRGSRRD